MLGSRSDFENLLLILKSMPLRLIINYDLKHQFVVNTLDQIKGAIFCSYFISLFVFKQELLLDNFFCSL